MGLKKKKVLSLFSKGGNVDHRLKQAPLDKQIFVSMFLQNKKKDGAYILSNTNAHPLIHISRHNKAY